MKKFISILCTILMLCLTLVTAYAYKPVDGDIIDVWGQMRVDEGDSLTETSDGIKITFGRPMWSTRVTTIDFFKLDGLTVSFKGVTVPNNNAIALGVFSTEGGWAGDKGIIFLQFSTAISLGLGQVENGYLMAKEATDLSDAKPRVINDTLLEKKPVGDFKVSFKKNADGSWIYEFNEQKFPISKEFIDANVMNQDRVYFSFGSWGDAAGIISYTVSDISVSGTAQPTVTKEPTAQPTVTKEPTAQPTVTREPAVTQPAVETSIDVSEAESDATSANSETISSESEVGTSTEVSIDSSSLETSSQVQGETSNTGTIIVIAIIAVALVSAGTAAFLLFKKQNQDIEKV